MMNNLFKANLYLKLFAFFKVPMLFFSGVKIVTLTPDMSVVKIPLNWRTKNHLKSMYFGALNIGADCAAGIYASMLILESKKKVHLSFKDCHATFIKRAMTDTYFVNQQGKQISEFIEKVIANPNTRMNLPLNIIAISDRNNMESVVATFVLTLSLKYPIKS